MDKTTFLETLKKDRAEWEGLLAQVDEAQMAQPGVVGEMSVKDLIAHVTWYEREMMGVLRERALVGSELWDRPGDQRNAAIFDANRDRALSDVRAEARQVFDALLDGVGSLADEELNDSGRFRDMPADWIPWQLLAENSYEHYRQHVPDLRVWLEKQS